MATLAQVKKQRRDLDELVRIAENDLRLLFRQVNAPDDVRDALLDTLPQFVAIYGAAAATLGADWYDELREMADTKRPFRATPAELPDRGRTDALARWAADPMYHPEAHQRAEGSGAGMAAALTLAAGGLQRIVANAHRQTVEESVMADPVLTGYKRHASANACAFCALLATRPAYYNSEQSARVVVGRGTPLSTNIGRTRGRPAKGIRARGTQSLGSKYHDGCHCIAVPVWDGQYEEAPYVAEWREAYAEAPAKPGEPIDLKATLSSMRQTLGTH